MSLEKYVIVEDTMCEGWQAWGESAGEIEVYDTEAEAQAEVDYDFKELRFNQIESGMWPDEEPSAFVIPLSEYTQGRKAIFK
tara:strand:+ start:534 stop:779 length:246 start_codon:yes stop_codon:yes gene_type:complete